jgi:PAS domain-containing protein
MVTVEVRAYIKGVMNEIRHEAVKQELYRLAFEDAPEATVVFAHDGRMLWLNRAAREMAETVLSELADPSEAHSGELVRLRAAIAECGRARAVVELAEGAVALDGRMHGRQQVVTVARVDASRTSVRGFATASLGLGR